MQNGFLILDEKDWEVATTDQRDWMIFKTLKSLDRRMQKLEKRPIIDKVFAFTGGLFGGALASFGIRWKGL